MASSEVFLDVPSTGSEVGSDDGWELLLSVDPAAVAGARRQAVDVYCVATLRHVEGTAGGMAVYHYSGTWTFGSGSDGTVALVRTDYPTAGSGPIADQVLPVT